MIRLLLKDKLQNSKAFQQKPHKIQAACKERIWEEHLKECKGSLYKEKRGK